MVLKCSSWKALVISLDLVLNSSNNSLEFVLEIKFKFGSDEVPGISSQELVQDLLQDCYIFSKLLNDTL